MHCRLRLQRARSSASSNLTRDNEPSKQCVVFPSLLSLVISLLWRFFSCNMIHPCMVSVLLCAYDRTRERVVCYSTKEHGLGIRCNRGTIPVCPSAGALCRHAAATGRMGKVGRAFNPARKRRRVYSFCPCCVNVVGEPEHRRHPHNASESPQYPSGSAAGALVL